ncbi:hypothetical protein acdb102_37370 [Acidothermaceae bacterium B102]|nr:hypothetical protein acdb102_37370 [Acidothermaceae bacterium B102]
MYGDVAAPRRTSLPRTLAALTLVAATLGSGTGALAATHEPPAPTQDISDTALARLQHRLDQATTQAARTADDVLRAAAESAALKINLDDVVAQAEQSRAQVAATAAALYEQAPPQGLPDLESLVIEPGAMQGLVQVGSAQVRSAEVTLQQASAQSAHMTALAQSSDKERASLVSRTVAVYAAQDKARALIATLRAALQAKERAAQIAKDKAAKAAAAAKLASLAAAKAALDAQSSQVSLAFSPGLSQAGRDALARQKPLLDTLVAAGGNYPPGYRPTGQTMTGVSSWYGPGFVGRSTASGTPYDPELLTCAMRYVPLGTVIRVTNLANNASVDVMVTDRGPYVGTRIIDLSHAAAVAVGNTGLATVRIEILTPTG